MTTFAVAGLALFAALYVGAALQHRRGCGLVPTGADLPGGTGAPGGPPTGERPSAADDHRHGDLTVARQAGPECSAPAATAAAAVVREPADGADAWLVVGGAGSRPGRHQAVK